MASKRKSARRKNRDHAQKLYKLECVNCGNMFSADKMSSFCSTRCRTGGRIRL